MWRPLLLFVVLQVAYAAHNAALLGCVGRSLQHWCDKPTARDSDVVFGQATDLLKVRVNSEGNEVGTTYVYTGGFTAIRAPGDTDQNRPRTCNLSPKGGEIKQIRQMFKQNDPPQDQCNDGRLARSVFYILSGRCGDHGGQLTFFVDPCGIRYREADVQGLTIPAFGGVAPRVTPQRRQPPPPPPPRVRDTPLKGALRAIANDQELIRARPPILRNLLFLMAGKYASEGIFRISGSHSDITKLVVAAHKTTQDQQAELLRQYPNVHDASGALKLYLREMPTRLFAGMWTAHAAQGACFRTNIDQISRCEDQIAASITSLPLHLKAILNALTHVWKETTANAGANKMTPSNQAIVFGPNLYPPTVSTDPMAMVAEMDIQKGVTQFIIENVPA